MALTRRGSPGQTGRHALYHVGLGIDSENECVSHIAVMDRTL